VSSVSQATIISVYHRRKKQTNGSCAHTKHTPPQTVAASWDWIRHCEVPPFAMTGQSHHRMLGMTNRSARIQLLQHHTPTLAHITHTSRHGPAGTSCTLRTSCTQAVPCTPQWLPGTRTSPVQRRRLRSRGTSSGWRGTPRPHPHGSKSQCFPSNATASRSCSWCALRKGFPGHEPPDCGAAAPDHGARPRHDETLRRPHPQGDTAQYFPSSTTASRPCSWYAHCGGFPGHEPPDCDAAVPDHGARPRHDETLRRQHPQGGTPQYFPSSTTAPCSCPWRAHHGSFLGHEPPDCGAVVSDRGAHPRHDETLPRPQHQGDRPQMFPASANAACTSS